MWASRSNSIIFFNPISIFFPNNPGFFVFPNKSCNSSEKSFVTLLAFLSWLLIFKFLQYYNYFFSRGFFNFTETMLHNQIKIIL